MFTLYTSNIIGQTSNCLYPKQVEVNSADDLKLASSHDFVCAKYKNSYRNESNFLESNCLPVDCDNDHSESHVEWVTPNDVARAFPGVAFAVHYSRHNNLEKDGKPPRPRFHILFPIAVETSPKAYKDMKTRVQKYFPYFDTNALDAARFFFGTQDPKVEWYEGDLNLTEFFYFQQQNQETIQQGNRNNHMSQFAGRVLKRLGKCDEAKKAFIEESKKCDPPLDREELQRIWKSALGFYNGVSKQDGYIPPEEYNANGWKFQPSDYSDVGQALVVAREHKEVLAYTDATDYLRFDGNRWLESKQLAVGLYEDFLDKQLKEADEVLESSKKALIDSGIDESIVNAGGRALEKEIGSSNMKAFIKFKSASAYHAFVMKHRLMKNISSVLTAAKPMLLKQISEFDAHEFLLNTPEGTVDLKTGDLNQHCSSDYLTKMTACPVNQKGKELWEDAVNKIFCGDQELIDYVQQIVGLSAIGKVFVEALVIAYGDGSNGKSTFWNTISRVLGDYSGVISADVLTVGCKRNPKPEMAELKGKRLVIAAELEEGVRLNTSIMKQLSSTDEVSAEKKYKDPFKFIPTYTVVLYTNYLPKVGATDDGTWRRLIVIPFNAKMGGKSDIKNYADYLVENAGSAVLSWIIEGAKKAIANNYILKAPKAVEDAIGKYRQNNDWLSSFLEECCEVDPTLQQKSGDLYQEYRNYCARTGEYTRSTTDFYSSLEIAGFTKRKTKNGAFVFGLQVKSEFLEES